VSTIEIALVLLISDKRCIFGDLINGRINMGLNLVGSEFLWENIGFFTGLIGLS